MNGGYLQLMLSEIVIRCDRDLAALLDTDWSNARVVGDDRFPLLTAHAGIVLAINCLGHALDLAVDENSHINTAIVTGRCQLRFLLRDGAITDEALE